LHLAIARQALGIRKINIGESLLVRREKKGEVLMVRNVPSQKKGEMLIVRNISVAEPSSAKVSTRRAKTGDAGISVLENC
jgi:hypothetical protein